MVNIIENWAEIKGRVTGVNDNSQLKGYHSIQIRIAEKNPYGNFPDLLNASPANELTINLKDGITESLQLKEGDTIQGLARAAGNNSYFFREDSIKVLQ